MRISKKVLIGVVYAANGCQTFQNILTGFLSKNIFLTPKFAKKNPNFFGFGLLGPGLEPAISGFPMIVPPSAPVLTLWRQRHPGKSVAPWFSGSGSNSSDKASSEYKGCRPFSQRLKSWDFTTSTGQQCSSATVPIKELDKYCF